MPPEWPEPAGDPSGQAGEELAHGVGAVLHPGLERAERRVRRQGGVGRGPGKPPPASPSPPEWPVRPPGADVAGSLDPDAAAVAGAAGVAAVAGVTPCRRLGRRRAHRAGAGLRNPKRGQKRRPPRPAQRLRIDRPDP